ncbi:MAG: hypothetical protein ISS17_09070 [Bacteroidales bacterium]|nr:hypothetical protein [Deltaproteobacteria bacterium]MBL7138913.1 hypothetical protein [Bacteroidales bacterium]
MKKITILLFLIAVTTCVTAQETTKRSRTFNYFNRTEAGFSFGVGNFKTDRIDGIQKTIRNDEMVISFQTINGIAYHSRIGLGIGIGVEKWQHGLFFPVFGQLCYDVRPRDNTFFGTVSLGSSIGKRYSTNHFQQGDGGFMFQVGIGYKMKVYKRLRFYYELFYKYQAIHSSYSNEISTDSIPLVRQVDYKVPLHFLGFRIGITFY